MTDRFSLEQIQQFWTEQAQAHGQAPAASWSDVRVIELEIAEILKRLADGDRVLDVGCANGFSTVQFAAQRKINIRGLDYIPQMIEQAQLRVAALADKLPGAVEFAVGDATALAEADETYDKVVVIRVIINLGEWERQLRGLRECARVLKRGGLLLLSEATVQGWRRLNDLRREWGLDDIPMPPFNHYLDHEQVAAALADELELLEVVDFAGTYYVGTRVLKPLLIRALGAHINAADPTLEWNRWFAQLPQAGDYGTQKLLVFRKRNSLAE